MTKEEFLEKFKNFPMTCDRCDKYSEECDTMDMCLFIRNKIIEYNSDTSAQHLNMKMHGDDIVWTT